MKIELVRKATPGSYNLYTVTNHAGTIIGLLEKYPDTKTEKHPWKAFSGHGTNVKFLRSYYPDEGGKKAALAAVVTAAG